MFKSIISWALSLFSTAPDPIPVKEPVKKRAPAAKKTVKPVVRKRAVVAVKSTRPKKVK